MGHRIGPTLDQDSSRVWHYSTGSQHLAKQSGGDTNCALVRTRWMVESIGVVPIRGHLSLKVFTLL